MPRSLSCVQQRPRPPLWDLRIVHLQQPVVRPELRGLRKRLRRVWTDLLRRPLRRSPERPRQLRRLRTRLRRIDPELYQRDMQRVRTGSNELRQRLRQPFLRQLQLWSLWQRLRRIDSVL